MRKKSNQVRGAHARIDESSGISGGQPQSFQRGNQYTVPVYDSRQVRQVNSFQTNRQGEQFVPELSNSNANKPTKGTGWKVVFVIAIIVLVGSLVALGAIVYQYWFQQQAYSDLESHVNLPGGSDNSNVSLSDLTVDWDSLRKINSDVVAWIYIPGTPVNYPVVQGKDNEEYLHKAFDQSTGWLASAGTIFLDSNNTADFSDRNNALYGHNMNDGSMFAAMAQWENSDEFNNHRDVYLLTPEGNYRLKTFAVVATTGSDTIVQTKFASDNDYYNYIEDKLERSVVSQTGIILDASDVKQSLLLSTCEYSQDDGRAVIFASVVETTVKNDAYVASTTEGTTGINQGESDSVATQYREAA